ncbi:hypothetical protein M3Y95_00914800 [Aphelenchoides besseyi]|nr:hypothetical protein M3Y95_00914800 [Aphelenchoides besseyi]
MNGTKDEMCELANKIAHDQWITTLVVLQVVFGLLTLWQFFCYFRTPAIRKATKIVELDLKIIAFCGFGYYLIGVSTALGVYVYKFIISLLDLSPCAYLWNNANCYFCYFQFAFASAYAYNIFHIALLLERLFTTFMPCCSKLNGLLGVIMVLIMYIGPNYFAYTIYVMIIRNIPTVYNGNRAFCVTLFNTTGNSGVSNSLLGLVAVDLLVTLADLLLLLYNRLQISRSSRRISDLAYNLNKSFKLREVKLSVRLIFPFSLGHSVGYCCQLIILSVFFRISDDLTIEDSVFWKECVNLTRTLTIWLMTLFLLFHEHYYSRKDSAMEWLTVNQNGAETETHFRQFEKIIS